MFFLNLNLQFSQLANKPFSTCLALSLIVVIQFIRPPSHHVQSLQSFVISQHSSSCLWCCSHQSPSQSSHHYSYLNNNFLPYFPLQFALVKVCSYFVTFYIFCVKFLSYIWKSPSLCLPHSSMDLSLSCYLTYLLSLSPCVAHYKFHKGKDLYLFCL